MKKVVLIGDSIRLSYEGQVKELLGGGITIWSPDENMRFARYTYNTIRLYNSQISGADIIHWNNGLWDTAFVYGQNKPFTSLKQYIKDLKIIAELLRQFGAKVIFATTTPTNPKKELDSQSKQYNKIIKKYNKAACRALKNKVDYINDLYSVVNENIDQYISQDFMHLTKQGSNACAKKVVEALSKVGLNND